MPTTHVEMSDSETSEANSGDSEKEIEDDVGEKEEEEEHIRQGIYHVAWE